MDKSCHSSASDSSATTSSTNTTTTTTTSNNYLRHLNKLSQKISKPPQSHSHNPLVKKPNFEPPPPSAQHNLDPPPPQHNHTHSNLHPPPQQQPPVYNINKNDFRDVVQKLTGSPAHDRFSNPPPINNPKPQSSRLQRIRPPPLAQLTNRPPPLLNCSPPPPPPPPNLNPNHLNPSSAGFIHRPGAPLSPLPPLPAVHAAAESPVSAYMRYLHASMAAVDPNFKPFSGFHPLSPRWGSLTAPPPPPLPGSSAGFGSPPLLPFGCLNSPRSPYALRSPNSGQFGIPLSPTVPVPSPTWRGL